MPKPTLVAALAPALLALVVPSVAQAADGLIRTPLKPFNVTIRVFDTAKGVGSGTDYVLPVDSPDAEHAVASKMANAASFTRKSEGDKANSTIARGRTAGLQPTTVP